MELLIVFALFILVPYWLIRSLIRAWHKEKRHKD